VCKVSVVTVCKNEVSDIRRTLESVSSQKFRDFESIVIDGGSTDGTQDVINEFRADITYFVSEPDSGIYAAQNKGIEASKGDYLLFINGGDAIHDDTVLEEIFSTDPTEDILYGNMLIEEQDGSETLGRSPPEITLDFLLRGTLWHPITFIKKQLFERFGLFDENLRVVADYDFFVKTIIVEEVSTHYFPRTISRFNTNGIGSSLEWKDIHEKERDLVQKKYFSRHVLRMYSELEKYRTHNEMLNHELSALKLEASNKKQPIVEFWTGLGNLLGRQKRN